MTTQEQLDKRWYTCRKCGITKEDLIKNKEKTGKFQSNYVSDGMCRICREIKENTDDFEEAKRTGAITRDESIMCPYCGFILDIDLFEYHNDSNFSCPKCDKDSDLTVEYTAHFTTTKKEGKNDWS